MERDRDTDRLTGDENVCVQERELSRQDKEQDKPRDGHKGWNMDSNRYTETVQDKQLPYWRVVVIWLNLAKDAEL